MNISASLLLDSSPAQPIVLGPYTKPACLNTGGSCSYDILLWFNNTAILKRYTIGFVADDVYVSNVSFAGDGSLAVYEVRSVYDNALYQFSYAYFSDANVSVTPVFAGYVFPSKTFSFNVYNVSTVVNNVTQFFRVVAHNNKTMIIYPQPSSLKIIVSSATVNIYSPNMSLFRVSVFVDGSPWRNYSLSSYLLSINVPGSTVVALFNYYDPVASYLSSAPSTASVYVIGFRDNVTKPSLDFGVLINVSQATLFINASGSYYSSFAGYVGVPRIDVVTWSCQNNILYVYYMPVYQVSNYTVYRVYMMSQPVPSCISSATFYISLVNGSPISLERVGGTLGDSIILLATCELQIIIQGPLSPTTIIRYITLNAPVTIEFVPPNSLNVYSGGSYGLTLKNMRGWTLSYSISGTSVSGILIAGSEQTIYVPMGLTLLVIADPSTRTISIVQASPPPVVYAVSPTATVSLPTLSLPSFKPSDLVLSPGLVSPVLVVGLFTAVLITAHRLTGSLGKSMIIASASALPLALATAVLTGDLRSFGIIILGVIIGAAIRYARD
jgi:hypothetical protein